MSYPRLPAALSILTLSLVALASVPSARADALLDANERAAAHVSTIRATPVAVRAMAIVQVAVHDAVASIEGRDRPWIADVAPASGASVDAAVAAATHAALLALVPDRRDAIEGDYRAALAVLPDDGARTAGIAVGERAAAAVLAARAHDGADAADDYRPRTTPGVYVPTTRPAVPHWGRRTPWVLRSGDELRPGPPPRLDSATWRRDLAEIAAVGARASVVRTPEQTAAARFWETTSPAVYWPLAREVAAAREHDASGRARLFAAVAIAMDDALIAVFDAKYAYGFWRPITAVRNATGGVGDPTWEPLIETPMHPEYPCAHCIVSAALAEVLAHELSGAAPPPLSSTSPTAGGAERHWSDLDAFVHEVSEARICDGVHYRNSTEVGQHMGRRIGARAAERLADGATR